jgi:hypothetical protein
MAQRMLARCKDAKRDKCEDGTPRPLPIKQRQVKPSLDMTKRQLVDKAAIAQSGIAEFLIKLAHWKDERDARMCGRRLTIHGVMITQDRPQQHGS